MGDGEKNNALRAAGFDSVASAHEANAARTAEAIWASVDEIHAQNAARVAPQRDAMEGIPTIHTRQSRG